MTSFAREAIKKSFFSIAEKKPVDKISVKDIVEECGINRNSFYYHFEDLPHLIRVSIEEEMEKIIEESSGTQNLEGILDRVADFILEHKNACLHIYQSKHRDLLEYNFLLICQQGVSEYFERSYFKEFHLSDQSKQIIVYYYKCLFFGILSDWVNSGLRFDIKERLKKVFTLRKDMPLEMCRNAQDLNNI
jgi:AcrR family transcriptional regulator